MCINQWKVETGRKEEGREKEKKRKGVESRQR